MTDKLDQEIERFFTDELLPLAEQAKAKGVRFLETQLATDVQSYYVKRKRVSMAKEDFETGGCASAEEVEDALRALWKDDGVIGLNRLAPGMAKLAKASRTVEKESDDVSNFLYVMY